MRSARYLSLAAFLFTLSTGTAAARCEGAVMLGALHDAYHATLVDSGSVRMNAARTLLVLVGGNEPETFARQASRAGITVPAERLAGVLRDAQHLAEATLNGQRGTSPGFRHSLNIDWLADTYLDTNCQGSAATASRSTGEPVWQSETMNKSTQGNDTFGTSTLIYAAGTLVLAALLAYGARRLHTSLFMRRKRVERLPRNSVDMTLEVTYTDTGGEMLQSTVKVIDISAGGMKVAWEGAPPAGTTATFQLLSSNRLAQVAWANNFYAGVMFDTMLNKKELSALVAANPA